MSQIAWMSAWMVSGPGSETLEVCASTWVRCRRKAALLHGLPWLGGIFFFATIIFALGTLAWMMSKIDSWSFAEPFNIHSAPEVTSKLYLAAELAHLRWSNGFQVTRAALSRRFRQSCRPGKPARQCKYSTPLGARSYPLRSSNESVN